MKSNHISRMAVVGLLTLTTAVSWGQKKSLTDAALAFKSFETSFQSQDIENAKKNLLKAKGFIDQAAVHPDTEKSPKLLFYKGEIYASIQLLRGLNDVTFNAATPENSIDIATEAYTKAYTTSNDYDPDIENSVSAIRQIIDVQGQALFDAKKYKEAAQAYDANAKVLGILGEADTVSYYYAAVASLNAEDWDNSAKYYRILAEMNYRPEETYLNAATSMIKAKREEEAMKFLDEAITKAPKDKYLYYVLGTVYMDHNDDQKVNDNFSKAIEIDPKFSDAQFNLGSYYFSKGLDLRNKAVDVTDKKEQDALLAQSVDYFNKSSAPLEAYIAIVPTDKDVLKSLWQINRFVLNKEKEAKYKKLYEEAK